MEKAFVAVIVVYFAIQVFVSGGLNSDSIASAFGATLVPAAIGMGLVVFARKRGKPTTWYAFGGILVACLFGVSAVHADLRDLLGAVGRSCQKQMTTQGVGAERSTAYCGCLVRQVTPASYASYASDRLLGGTSFKDTMRGAAGMCQTEALRVP